MHNSKSEWKGMPENEDEKQLWSLSQQSLDFRQMGREMEWWTIKWAISSGRVEILADFLSLHENQPDRNVTHI